MATDEVRRSKRIITAAAVLAVLAVAGFWVTRGDARSERTAPPEVTLEEPSLVEKGLQETAFPGMGIHPSLMERMTAHFELSQTQIQKAQTIMDKYGPRLRELRELAVGDEAALAEANRLRTERNKRLSEILTDKQRQKLPTFSWRRPSGMFPGI